LSAILENHPTFFQELLKLHEILGHGKFDSSMSQPLKGSGLTPFSVPDAMRG
jgi:hypothetical protein